MGADFEHQTISTARVAALRRFVPRDRPALRLLLKRSRQALSSGRTRESLATARLAVLLYPKDLAARLHLSRMLLSELPSEQQRRSLIALLEEALQQAPGHDRFLEVAVKALIDALRSGADQTSIDSLVALLDTGAERALSRLFGSAIRSEVSFGRTDTASDAAQLFYDRHPSRSSASVLHQTLVAASDFDGAAALAERAFADDLASPEQLAYLHNEAAFARKDLDAVVDRLRALRPQREPRYSTQLIAALAGSRRWSEILEYLDGTAHGLTHNTEVLNRVDAHIGLGEFEVAIDLAQRLASENAADIRVFRRLRAALLTTQSAAEVATTLGSFVRDLEGAARSEQPTLDTADLTQIATLYFELDDFYELDRLVSTSPNSSIGPSVRRLMARSLYYRRQFDSSLEWIDQVLQVAPTWDIEKLRARILFERGDFEAAIEARHATPQTDGALDEVLYHALLCAGRFEEAFSMYCPPADLAAFRAAFGDRVRRHVDSEPTGPRMIVAQAGPGDEVSLASIYPIAARLASKLFVTCDPRLHALFTRSFPDIEFVPVDRHGAGTRVSGVQHVGGLLDQRAAAVAAKCDQIIPLRAIAGLKHSQLETAPPAPYLSPDPATVDSFRRRWGTDRAPVGLVWRSEVGGSQRAIHYLRVEDLDPILSEAVDFVCLQYDITDAERAHLVAQCGDRITFVDDVDIRNDFEQTSALLASLQATLGIGTTTVELSGAVGTKTVMIQPTFFGTWRAQGECGVDYWHKTVRVTDIAQPWDRVAIVEQARRRLLEATSEAC